jgi:hypothetical protein
MLLLLALFAAPPLARSEIRLRATTLDTSGSRVAESLDALLQQQAKAQNSRDAAVLRRQYIQVIAELDSADSRTQV